MYIIILYYYIILVELSFFLWKTLKGHESRLEMRHISWKKYFTSHPSRKRISSEPCTRECPSRHKARRSKYVFWFVHTLLFKCNMCSFHIPCRYPSFHPYKKEDGDNENKTDPIQKKLWDEGDCTWTSTNRMPTKFHLSSTKEMLSITLSNVLIGKLVIIMIQAEFTACWFYHSLFSRNTQTRL